MNDHAKAFLAIAMLSPPLILAWRRPALWTATHFVRIGTGIFTFWACLVAAVWLDAPWSPPQGEDCDAAVALTQYGWVFGIVWMIPLVAVQAICRWGRQKWKPNHTTVICQPADGLPQPSRWSLGASNINRKTWTVIVIVQIVAFATVLTVVRPHVPRPIHEAQCEAQWGHV